MMRIGKVDSADSAEGSEVRISDDSEVDNEDSISEILILAISWAVFLVVDSADELEEKVPKVEKTSKLP